MRYNRVMDELKINSRGYLLWNNTQGLMVAEKDADEQAPIASLTKMMTALIAVEQRELDEIVEITPEMLQGLEEFAVIGLMSGQKLSVEELLYATMLPSAGDAAQALAISTSGSIEEFAKLMNQKAAELGMTNTHFSNPVGFDEDNYSTPRDMMILVKAAVQNPAFRKFFETFEADLPSINKKATKTFQPQAHIKGGKTGFTNAAGRCLASLAEVEGEEYILVTIGAESGENVRDANKIYNFVAENYEPVQILAAGETILRVPVEQSATKSISFSAEQDVTVALKNETKVTDLKYVYEGATEITEKTEAQSKLGTYRILQGEQELYSQDIYYMEKLEFYNYGFLALGAGITIGILILAIVAFVRKRRKLAIAGFVIFLVSLVLNFCLFRGWFEPGETLEVYQPQENAEVEPQDAKDIYDTEEPGSLVDLQAGIGLESNNCTTKNGNLMLINPNFTVDTDFIQSRSKQLISVSQTYGIQEYHPQGNGDNLMIPEAAEHLNEMLQAYRKANPGHEMGTYSCFRSRGTSCGRLCAATGASDHHTGLTCDLIDLEYGSVLDSDDYADHIEWQWLKENSYKYGFIDRFPEAWAGGSMLEPLNVDEFGSTGLFETWHYRYVGVEPATEIALGKYNNGEYDSLEHYLKAVGVIADLKAGVCAAE